jgi:hypothetical protein
MRKLLAGLIVLAATASAACFAGAARAGAPGGVFDGAGVFVDDTADFPGPWALAERLQAAHFRWVALHVNEGLVGRPVDALWVDVLHAHGLAVGGWGVEKRHPLIEAVIADQAVRNAGLDFYIADAEHWYERPTPGGWRRSATFVRTFRSLEPTLPAALVTYGAAPAPFVIPIDYAAWRDAGFDLLPEAYYNQYRDYRPDLTVAHALRAGWPIARVHPVIGVYHRYPAAKYVPLLQRAGTRGFSVFLADQARAGDYDALASLAAASG